MSRLVSISLGLFLLGLSVSAQARPCTVYVYLDSDGNTVKTRKLAEVPPNRRSSMISYQDDCKTKLKNVAPPERGLPAAAFHDDGSLKDDWESVQTRAERPQAKAGQEAEAHPSYKVPDRWLKSRRSPSWMRILLLGSLLLIVAGTIGVLVEAWRQSILWFIAVLIFPFIWLIFSILAWHRVKVPFLAGLIGYAGLLFIGLFYGVSFFG